MNTKVEMTGKRFGRLTVLEECNEHTKHRQLVYKCQCDCGNTVTVRGYKLRSGHTKSCGCLRHEKYALKHGKRHTRLYSIWLNMKDRCCNKNTPRYNDYGSRGIVVCDEWKNDFMTFHNWAMENGYRDDLTIDRINNDGNYEPGNCKWSTPKQQANNTRSNVWLTFNDKTQTMMQWSEELNIPYITIKNRHRKGWSDKECLFGKVV